MFNIHITPTGLEMMVYQCSTNISAPSGARDYIIPECYTHFVHAINLRSLQGLEIIFHLNAAQRTPAPDVIYDLSMIWDYTNMSPTPLV